jgi:hypothetical protein
MSARIRALVNVERPVIIIVDDTVTPAEEYLEIEFETQADASAAVELPIPGEAARRSGMMPPTDSGMISPTVPR